MPFSAPQAPLALLSSYFRGMGVLGSAAGRSLSFLMLPSTAFRPWRHGTQVTGHHSASRLICWDWASSHAGDVQSLPAVCFRKDPTHTHLQHVAEDVATLLLLVLRDGESVARLQRGGGETARIRPGLRT